MCLTERTRRQAVRLHWQNPPTSPDTQTFLWGDELWSSRYTNGQQRQQVWWIRQERGEWFPILVNLFTCKGSYCKSSRYVEICSYMYCIQQDFCPMLFSPFSIANSFAPSWIRRNKVVFKRDYVRHWNSRSLKFACCQRGGKWRK